MTTKNPVRRTLAAALAALALAVPAGCATDARADHDAGLRPVRIVLDWTPNTNHLGLYLALENGWFAEKGLDPQIVEPGEASGLSLVAAGTARASSSPKSTRFARCRRQWKASRS